MRARLTIAALRMAFRGGLALVVGVFPVLSQQLGGSLLPPGLGVPASEPAVIAAMPAVPKAPLPNKTSGLPRPETALNVAPVRAENLAGQAGDHFLSGKSLLQQGDLQGARREFDLTVDLMLAALAAAPNRQPLEKTFDEFVEAIHHYDVEALGAGVPLEEASFDKSPLEEILALTFPIDPRLKDKVKEELRVTGSELPLAVNDAVLSYVNYFSSERGRRTMAAGLRRAARYRPLIARILAEEDVPQEMIHLAQAESGFYPRAVSRMRATGMWQFILFRGQEYGLKRTPWFDDRLDPEKATRAAARHLRDLYHIFGDWYLAMAAYNCGPMGVQMAVERTGYADFWELRNRRVLPRETSNYVPAILAMVIVAKNAKDYGLGEIEGEPPLEYDTVEIAAPTNLALVADAAERLVSEIRELNPALLRSLAPAGYQLRVPKGSLGKVASALEAVPAASRAAWRLHRVGAGDTLASIARRYSVAATAITSANPAGDGSAEPGDVLLIPGAYREPNVSQPARAGSHALHKRAPVRKAAPVRRTAETRAPRTQEESAYASASLPAARRTRSSVGN